MSEHEYRSPSVEEMTIPVNQAMLHIGFYLKGDVLAETITAYPIEIRIERNGETRDFTQEEFYRLLGFGGKAE